MDRQDVAHVYNGRLLKHKKGQNCAILRDHQGRAANLEPYLTVKGLACTLQPNLLVSAKLLCCNFVGMPKADPVFPCPAPCSLCAGQAQRVSFLPFTTQLIS